MKKQVSPLVTVIVILVVVVIVALLWNYFTTRPEVPAGTETPSGPQIGKASPAEVAKWKGRQAELLQEARDQAAQANQQAQQQRRPPAAAGGGAGGPGGKGE